MNGRLRLLFASMFVAAIACSVPFYDEVVRGSGDLVTVEEAVSGFDRLEAHHSFTVDIVQSQTFSVTVRVDDNVEPYLIIDRQGDTLVLDLKEGQTYVDVSLEAQIAMPTLRSLELSGASDATFTLFESADPFELVASGASRAVGDIEAGDVTIQLSGASDVRIEGDGLDLNVEASGASFVDLGQFTVDNATLDLSGSSEVIVSVDGVLNVSASGASEVTYFGSPELGDIETSGASEIHVAEYEESVEEDDDEQ